MELPEVLRTHRGRSFRRRSWRTHDMVLFVRGKEPHIYVKFFTESKEEATVVHPSIGDMKASDWDFIEEDKF